MALSDRFDLRIEDLSRAGDEDTQGITKGLLRGAAIGALAGAVLVSLVEPQGLDALIYTASGRALLVLAGMGAGGAIGALSGIVRATGRELFSARRSDRLA